jgi:hypothetical protein
MGYDFPNAPTVGQAYSGYAWDGEKWTNGPSQGAIYVGDSAPAAPINSLWWESDTGILYFKFDDGTSVQWVAIADGGAGAVRFDMAQTLTAPQQTQARVNIAAAPLDALAYSGLQINGSMEVNQEAPGAVVTPNKYVLDGWMADFNLSSGTVSYGPTPLTTEIPGFTKCLQFVVGTAQASMGTNYVRFTQRIEGYRFSRLGWGTAGAVPLTMGFWVRAAVAGTYRVLITNSDFSVGTGYTPFTITTGPFQWVTITFPAQTTGTWKTDNTAGCVLMIEMASSGTPNLMATAGNYASITGVVVLPGIEVPSAARSPLIMRPYDQELVTCQRYWHSAFDEFNAVTVATAGAKVSHRYFFPCFMRATPAITRTAFSNGGNTISIDAISINLATCEMSLSPSATNVLCTGTAVFSVDARL